MSHPTRRHLLVFGREPVPGRAKTRLIPRLGAAGAARLYRKLLEVALQAAAGCPADSRALWLDRAPASAAMQALADRHQMDLRLQQGADLGSRMATALSTTLATARETAPGDSHALLIGSDCPGFDAAYLEAGFAALQTHDVVIGPATDGGYVLLGLARFDPALFADVPWSTGAVLETTRARIRSLGWRWCELAPLPDIDEPADLVHLPGRRPGAGLESPPVPISRPGSPT